MTETVKVIRKGWALPGASRKYHYFNSDSTSLCRKWLFMADAEAFDDTNDDHEDNCAVCKKKKAVLNKKTTK